MCCARGEEVSARLMRRELRSERFEQTDNDDEALAA